MLGEQLGLRLIGVLREHNHANTRMPGANGMRGFNPFGVLPRRHADVGWRQHWLTMHRQDSGPMDWQCWLTLA